MVRNEEVAHALQITNKAGRITGFINGCYYFQIPYCAVVLVAFFPDTFLLLFLLPLLLYALRHAHRLPFHITIL
jgi:hypothetical protein